MYYVYLLECIKDKGWYIGYTSDLKKRFSQHNSGNGARTTRNKTWNLIYYEAYRNKSDAEGRERYLKSGSGRKFIKRQLAHYFNGS